MIINNRKVRKGASCKMIFKAIPHASIPQHPPQQFPIFSSSCVAPPPLGLRDLVADNTIVN